MPLVAWLDVTRAYLKGGEAWAVDAFAERDARVIDPAT
jgi:hypothetical protein